MIWRFTILQATTETVIDEPVEWASIDKIIQRDADTHGIVFNSSVNTLTFIEDAYWIIKEEYILKGVDGDLGLRIEWLCDDCEGWQIFGNGDQKLDFNKYNEICEDDCSVAVGLQASDAEVLITNRMDTAVDLTSNLAYDNTTVLPYYSRLGVDTMIPAKALLLKDEANTTAVDGDNGYDIFHDADYNFAVPPDSGSSHTLINDGFILPKLNNITLTEVDTFNPSYQTDYVADFTGSPILDVAPVGIAAGLNQYDISLRYKGNLKITYSAAFADNLIVRLGTALKYAPEKTDAFAPVVFENFNNPVKNSTVQEHNIAFDFAWTGTVGLNTGEKIWSGLTFYTNITAHDAPYFNPIKSLLLTIDTVSYFKINNRSLTNPTPAKTYMIHEAASRIFENITNGEYRFKSSLYGRTDSQPYAFDTNGCAGLRALTNGLRLRRAVLQDNSLPKVFLSAKDLFESCNAKDCIGMGIEGKNVVFEGIKYFYSDEIIFVCDGVDKITTTVRNDKVYNQFNFGYDKFETESTNGLDAIHTKRQYRLQIKNTDQKLEQISKIIADGYAIEVTRRKFGTTDDWRYDQNIFMFCMNGAYAVEQGNITNPANIFDPPTVINYAVSPVRNAMRWFKWITQGYRNGGNMTFSSGEGNYVASGKLNTGCVNEASAIAENSTIDAVSFADANESQPFVVPEKVSFTFPMGLNEFVSVSAKKYGKIQFRRYATDEWQYGWIDSLKFSPNDGSADFDLITCKA